MGELIDKRTPLECCYFRVIRFILLVLTDPIPAFPLKWEGATQIGAHITCKSARQPLLTKSLINELLVE